MPCGSESGWRATPPLATEPHHWRMTEDRRFAGARSHERLFALGTRTLADLIAPAGAEIRRDHLQLDAQYLRALVVTGYPRTVAAGWLAPLVEELDLPLELSLHVRPLTSGDMVRALGLQIAKLESSRRVDVLAQRINDPERDIGIEDAERLRDALQRGDERVFSVSLYLLLRAPTRRALDELTRRVETQLDGLLCHSRVALFEQERASGAVFPKVATGSGAAQPRHELACDIAAAGEFVAGDGARRAVRRRGADQSPIIIDPFDSSFLNYNLAVIAPSGSGKSYFTKLLALRHLVTGTEFLVIDPEDEYRAVAEAAGGLIVRLAASSPHRLNPLDLVRLIRSQLAPPTDPLAHSIAVVLAGWSCFCALEQVQPALLASWTSTNAQYSTRHSSKRTTPLGSPRIPPHTNAPRPSSAHLHAVLNRMDSDVAGHLAMRLRRHIPGAGSLGAGVFAGRTNVMLDQPFVVFHIRELPKELWPLAIHLISSHVWNYRATRSPPEAAGGRRSGDAACASLRWRVPGRRGAPRSKHYLGLVTIWQKVGDLTGSEHGDTILTNSEMKLLLKQSEEIIDAADARFRFTPGERRLLLGALKGEGCSSARGGRWPIKIEASPAEHRLATTNPRDLSSLAQAAATRESDV